jgi:hypothetical protein
MIEAIRSFETSVLREAHGVTSQKRAFVIFTAVRTSYLKHLQHCSYEYVLHSKTSYGGEDRQRKVAFSFHMFFMGTLDPLNGVSRDVAVCKKVTATLTRTLCVSSDVLTAVTMKNAVFWDIKTQFVPHRRHITSPLQIPAS